MGSEWVCSFPELGLLVNSEFKVRARPDASRVLAGLGSQNTTACSWSRGYVFSDP